MLETVTLQRIPPVAARRYPLRRVITRPRPEAALGSRNAAHAVVGIGVAASMGLVGQKNQPARQM
jgi:hypothetical protein